MKCWIGIDNGVSGTIGVVNEKGESDFYNTPVKSEQSYTKTKQNITRIEVNQLKEILEKYSNAKVFVERPMVNPRMFKASISAVRSLEATLNVLELLELPYQYCDSKEWQKSLLPKGIKGSPALKKASHDIGIRLFPVHKKKIEKHKDADGLLIAEYFRRKNV